MTVKCPCCGQQADLPLTVDLNTNTAMHRGASVKLMPQEAEMLKVVADHYPGTIRFGALITKMWGVAEPDSARRILWVKACGIRKRIKPLGLSIETVHSVGYRLEKLQERAA